jgi:UPF0755 protein
MKKILFLLTTVTITAILGFLIYREGTMPVNKTDSSEAVFVINQGESLNEIIEKLRKYDLIRSKVVFYTYIRFHGLDRKLQAGVFNLNKTMDIHKLVNTLLTGSLDVSVTVVEGLRKEQIADLLEEKIGLNRIAFINETEEGYLFPDTYFIPKEASVSAVINILKRNFTKKYTESVLDIAKSHNHSMKDVVILASLIEREANNENDRKTVANVLKKRLLNDWPLQVDATVQYILGYDAYEKTWWRKNITLEELKVNSPYNTYVNLELPPSPICNPGLSSLIAAAEATGDTPYWFYLTGKDGVTRFSKTIEEHQSLIDKHL